jgi:hypothetical protein
LPEERLKRGRGFRWRRGAGDDEQDRQEQQQILGEQSAEAIGRALAVHGQTIHGRGEDLQAGSHEPGRVESPNLIGGTTGTILLGERVLVLVWPRQRAVSDKSFPEAGW